MDELILQINTIVCMVITTFSRVALSTQIWFKVGDLENNNDSSSKECCFSFHVAFKLTGFVLVGHLTVHIFAQVQKILLPTFTLDRRNHLIREVVCLWSCLLRHYLRVQYWASSAFLFSGVGGGGDKTETSINVSLDCKSRHWYHLHVSLFYKENA